MVAPAVAIGAGLAAGGLAGSIFGRKKVPSFDTRRIEDLIQAGGQEQRAQIGRLRPETEAQLKQFRTDTEAAQGRATTGLEASRNRFLSELDPVTSRLLQSQTDQLKQTTFGAIPEAQRAAREALAASGGLGRGVAAEELARIPINAAQDFSRGAAGLQQESLRTMQDALSNLQSQESQLIAKNLGIDQDTYNTILNTGNAALINELNALVDESKRRTEGLIGAEQFRQTGNIANAAADEANRQAIFQSLTQLGGTVAGLGAPSGLPTGVEELTAAQRNRQAMRAAR